MTNGLDNRIGVILFLGATAFATGCGSDAEAPPASNGEAACTPTGSGYLCAPNELRGFPFVSFAVSYSYDAGDPAGIAAETTVSMSQPEPGKLCLSGRVAPDETLAGFNLHFSPRNQEGTEILARFDAAQRNITQASLVLESPPSTGVNVGLFTVKQLDCPTSPLDCNNGFELATIGAGRATIPFANFISEESLDALLFQVGPGDYDFCISEFKLLDAQGVEVEP